MSASPPIRVLLIAPSQEILGGQAVQASRIYQEIAKVPDLAMTFLPINPRLPTLLEWTRRIKYLRTATNFLNYMVRLLWSTARTDIVHVFAASYWSYTLWSMPAILAGKLFGKVVILNYRDGQCADHLEHWRSALPTIRLADAVVTPSGFLVDVFARFGVQAQSILNFIDVSGFLYRRRGPVRPVFMTNRILEPLYNVPCILRAFRRVQDRYPEASLTVAHDGPLRQELEQQAADLQLRNTRFIGRVPHAGVPRLYDEAEIYLTSPNIDCMPGSLLECMASGLPIVATAAGGIPYIVRDGETALLVGLDDDEALADCCFRLLEDPELVRRLTDNGLETVRGYGADVSREKWAALYRHLTARGLGAERPQTT